MIVKENLIYAKIKDNDAPFWTLYTVNSYIRSDTPIDTFVGDETLQREQLIKNSINRLKNTLDLYRHNIADNTQPVFSIVMKPTARSHGDKVYEFTFKLDIPDQLQGTAQTQQNNTQNTEEIIKTITDITNEKIQVAVKQATLSQWEERLKAWEQELAKKEKELEQEFDPYKKMADRAVIKLVEIFAGDSPNRLQGIENNEQPEDPKTIQVENLAQYIYDNFTIEQLPVIDAFVKNLKTRIENEILKKQQQQQQQQQQTDSTTETSDAATD